MEFQYHMIQSGYFKQRHEIAFRGEDRSNLSTKFEIDLEKV